MQEKLGNLDHHDTFPVPGWLSINDVCFSVVSEILLKCWNILVTQDIEKEEKMDNILALIINFGAAVTQLDYLFSENSNPFAVPLGFF